MTPLNNVTEEANKRNTENKKLLVLCPYPEGVAPSQRLKYEQYFPVFRNNGWQITVDPFITASFWKIIYKKGNFARKIGSTILGYLRRWLTLFTIRRYDIVYIHLWGTPFGPFLYEWLVRRLAKKIIYDIDDLIFLKKAGHQNKYLNFLKGKQKAIFLMKHASHVITCTPFLDQYTRQFNQQTTDISSTVNTDVYIPVNNYQNDHQIILGWSGSHSTAGYLYLLKDVLLNLKKQIDFKLLVLGDRDFSIPGLDIEALDWSEEIEIRTLQRIDIGLYPLPLNEPWVLGKSGLKAIQYMALGIPPVATAIGCNDRVIEDKVSGFLVQTPAEWEAAIKQLCEHPELRRQTGEKARTRVEKYFSVTGNAPLYNSILETVYHTSSAGKN